MFIKGKVKRHQTAVSSLGVLKSNPSKLVERWVQEYIESIRAEQERLCHPTGIPYGVGIKLREIFSFNYWSIQ